MAQPAASCKTQLQNTQDTSNPRASFIHIRGSTYSCLPQPASPASSAALRLPMSLHTRSGECAVICDAGSMVVTPTTRIPAARARAYSSRAGACGCHPSRKGCSCHRNVFVRCLFLFCAAAPLQHSHLLLVQPRCLQVHLPRQRIQPAAASLLEQQQERYRVQACCWSQHCQR